MSKKKLLGIVLSLIVCSSTFLGCTKKTETAPTDASKPAASDAKTAELAKPAEMTITKVNLFGDAGENDDLKKAYQDYMSQQSGIKITFNAPPRNNYLEKVNLMVTSGELKGMVSLFTPNDMLKYRDDGVIEPLDDYLKDNKAWQSMPDEMKTMYKVDGQLWGLPTGLTGNMFTRAIRKDWLDKLGLKVPTTTQELYDVSKAFTLNDPDGNGKNDTIGMTSSGTWNLQDIFQAFDARLDHVGSSTVVWDPHRKVWEDSMLNPGMIQALKYLNDMYKNGYLDQETFTNKGSTMRDKMASAKYGSTFYWLMYGRTHEAAARKNDPNATFVEMNALKGTITDKLNQITFSNAPYVLLKGTKQPKETVNAFVNMFFGSDKAYFDGMRGIPGKTYRQEGNTIYQLKAADGKTPMATPDITQMMPKYDTPNFTYLPDGATDADKKLAADNNKLKDELMNGGLKSGVLYQMTTAYQVPISATYPSLSADQQKAVDEVIMKAITGQAAPEQLIANYREQMKKLGFQKVLDEANKAIGTTTVMKY